MKTSLQQQSGFTMIDLVLSMVVLSMLTAFVAEFFLSQTNHFMFVVNRQEALSDTRYTLNRISYELMRVDPQSDIIAFDTTSIEFKDEDGLSASFSLDTTPNGLGIYRDNILMADFIDSFEITYYDSSAQVLNPASSDVHDIARIQVKIIADEKHGEGDLALQTSITPRSVIGYHGFH